MNNALAGVYPPAVAELLAEAPLNPLGPGRPRETVRDRLAALTPDKLFVPGAAARDPATAACCSAALWLRYDFIDECHTLVQDIETPSAAYWHGIVHRREPDYGNAKYWFRRVGRHEIFAELNRAAAKLAAENPGAETEFLTQQPAWDPFAFIDLCEQAERGRAGAAEMLCRQVQAREWELLFHFCYTGSLASAT